MRLLSLLVLAAIGCSSESAAPTMPVGQLVVPPLSAISAPFEPEPGLAIPQIVIPEKRAFDHRYAISEEYDRFTRETVVTLSRMPLAERLELTIGYSIDQGDVYSAYMEFTASPQHSPEARDLELHAVVNGTPRNLGHPKSYRLDSADGASGELIVLPLETARLSELAMADSIAFRFGETEITLDGQQREALRDLASRIPIGKSRTCDVVAVSR